MRWRSAHDWAVESRQRYIGRVWALAEHVQTLEPREVLAFVLFTPQNRYERAVKDWQYWMKSGKKDVFRSNMWRKRERWLARLPQNDRLTRLTVLDETWDHYISDLVNRVSGLAWSKAPFFASLMYPTYPDVPVCIDVHMQRWLYRKEVPIKRETQYQRAQSLVARRAVRAGMPRFAYQWAVWDYVRSGGLPVTETSIKDDLIVKE